MSQLAVVIPGKDVHATLDRVLAEVPQLLLDWTFVVDDGSTPPLRTEFPVHLLRHPKNRGYGAAQKTGYRAAIEAGAERIVLLHGDGQYPTAPTLGLGEALLEADAAMGSRFLEHSGLHIPLWRRMGNRLLTKTANLRFGTRITELHSGARAFRASALQSLPLERYSDDYVFDQQVLVALLAQGVRFAERPLEASYDESVQSISFRRSVVYGLGCVRTIAMGAPV